MPADTSDVFDRVSALIQPHATVDTAITRETRIVADLGIDSVAMFDMMMEIEDAFDINFSVEEAASLDTVGSLADAIAARAEG